MKDQKQKGYFPEYKDIPQENLLPCEAPQFTEQELLQLHEEEELIILAQGIEYPGPEELK